MRIISFLLEMLSSVRVSNLHVCASFLLYDASSPIRVCLCESCALRRDLDQDTHQCVQA